jgi:tRNA-2-methylthio-N6-dimethylallyladenosine synthase
MNEYDSDKISDLMQSVNFVRSETLTDVDCIIFNTCHIREKATEKVYSDIGKIKKLNRSKKKPIFVLAGCIAQAQGEEIFKRTNYVDIVVGPQSTIDLPEQIKNFAERKENFSDTNFELIEKFDTLDNFKIFKKI